MKWPIVHYADGSDAPLNTLPARDLAIIIAVPMRDFGNGFPDQCKAIAAKLLQERAQ